MPPPGSLLRFDEIEIDLAGRRCAAPASSSRSSPRPMPCCCCCWVRRAASSNATTSWMRSGAIRMSAPARSTASSRCCATPSARTHMRRAICIPRMASAIVSTPRSKPFPRPPAMSRQRPALQVRLCRTRIVWHPPPREHPFHRRHRRTWAAPGPLRVPLPVLAASPGLRCWPSSRRQRGWCRSAAERLRWSRPPPRPSRRRPPRWRRRSARLRYLWCCRCARLATSEARHSPTD